MILIICSLLDKKSRNYKNPFFVPNADVATRSLKAAVNAQEKSDLTNYPEDFSLYQLGTFDDDSGLISAFTAPMHLCDALHLKKNDLGARMVDIHFPQKDA